MSDEHALDFARRVVLNVRQLRYSYHNDMNRCASAVFTTGTSDCGGLGAAVVATLRAAGIPARLLVGRWAKSAKPTDQLAGLPYGQWHVKLELFIPSIGWIPADAANEMQHPTKWFGEQAADFITMHYDSDITVTTLFGERTVPWMQGIVFWLRGDGNLDGLTLNEQWMVTSTP